MKILARVISCLHGIQIILAYGGLILQSVGVETFG
jgi:hypothetical protein